MTEAEQQERRGNAPTWSSLLAHALIALCGKPANVAAKWIPIAMALIYAAQPISDAVVALAGKSTMADFRMSATADIKVNPEDQHGAQAKEPDTQRLYFAVTAIVGAAIGIGGLFAAFRQRRLRQDVIETMSNRIQLLEHMIDPNRTTSGLTVRGETNPEDQ